MIMLDMRLINMAQIKKIYQLLNQLLKSHRNELLTEKTINDISFELLDLLIDDITEDVMK